MNTLSKILTVVLLIAVIACQDHEQQVKSKEVQLNFNGKIINAKMVFNKEENRVQLISDEIVEIKAINKKTNQPIYVYTLINSKNGKVDGIKRGYYGYSEGCYYYGTLYESDTTDESLFVVDDGENAIFNPPICPGGDWA